MTHLVSFPLDGRSIYMAAAEHARYAGTPPPHGDDIGYMIHMWSAAVFGDTGSTAKPFVIPATAKTSVGRFVKVIAYSEHSADALCEMAAVRRKSAAYAYVSCDWDNVTSRAMPKTWERGQRFEFTVRTCPLSRTDRGDEDRYIESERVALATGSLAPRREDVYAGWLASQLAMCGALMRSVSLVGFSVGRFSRRRHAVGDRRHIFLPDAHFVGELEVADPEAFGTLLSRGVGTHRAFGFGMVFLKSIKT